MRRVDVADPTPEGASIAEALRAHGIDVLERSIASLHDGSDAAVVILAGDAEGALEALSIFARLEDSATAPVLLVGSPVHDPFDTDVAVELGADAFYGRPVPLERIVRKVSALLELLMPLPPEEVAEPPVVDLLEHDPSHAISQVLVVVRPEVSEVVPLPIMPEPTMQLGAERSLGDWKPPERTIQLTDGGSVPRSPSELPAGTPASDSGAQSTSVGSAPPSLARPSAPIAELSPELAKMLVAADRRVFPTLPPIDLAFAASHEPPEVLVPAELLEPGAQVDPIEDDPLDAFTWVGQRDATMSPALTPGPPPSQPPPPTHASQSPASKIPASAAPPRPPRPLRTETPPSEGPPTPPEPLPARPARLEPIIARRSSLPPPARARGAAQPSDEPLLGEPTEGGAGRRGILADAGVLPLLARIVELQLDVEVSFTLQPELELTLVLVAGEVRALDGPVALRVVEGLRRERRAQETPRDEADAAAILERRVQGGLLDRFELDRRLARARESVLHDAVGARSGAFVLEPLDGPAIDAARAAPAVLLGSLVESLLEGTRRRFDARRARQLLSREPVAVALAADARARLAQLRISPELAALVLRHDGLPLDTLLGAASPGEGLPGLLFGLSALGILETRPLAATPPTAAEQVRSARELVRAMASLADDGDYFAILGLDPSAGARDAEAAWTDRRRELERLELDAFGLDELAPLRDAVLEVLDEAHDVLCDDALRERYRTALGLGRPAGVAP